MGMYYYFYKSDTDKDDFESGKIAGIPDDLGTKYGLESINHYRENCSLRKNDNGACSCCDCSSVTRYKISRENGREIAKDMYVNQTLFDDLMNFIMQDFLWIRLDY
jgi:hypothetical protein